MLSKEALWSKLRPSKLQIEEKENPGQSELITNDHQYFAREGNVTNKSGSGYFLENRSPISSLTDNHKESREVDACLMGIRQKVHKLEVDLENMKKLLNQKLPIEPEVCTLSNIENIFSQEIAKTTISKMMGALSNFSNESGTILKPYEMFGRGK